MLKIKDYDIENEEELHDILAMDIINKFDKYREMLSNNETNIKKKPKYKELYLEEKEYNTNLNARIEKLYKEIEELKNKLGEKWLSNHFADVGKKIIEE